VVGCNNGGLGVIFPEVKRLVAKWIGTRKRLFSGFFAARVRFLRRRNFFPWHILPINPYMHICPCSWALGICKNIGVHTYFIWLRSNLWGVFATLRFGATDLNLPVFLLNLRTTFFEAHLLIDVAFITS